MKVRSAAVGRFIGLAAIALAAVSPAAYSAAAGSTADTRPAEVASGFAGPVATPPRALDTDMSASARPLHRVPCAAMLPGARCWVFRR